MYRENAGPKRERRIHGVAVRAQGMGGIVALLVAIVVLSCATWGVAVSSVSVTCTRAADGAEPMCVARAEALGPASTRSFRGRPGALSWRSVETGDGTTIYVFVNGTKLDGASTDQDDARELVAAYERFLAHPHERRLEQKDHPSTWRILVQIAFLALLVLAVGSATQRTVLTIDLDEDRLSVATRSWFRTHPVLTLDWTEIAKLEAVERAGTKKAVFDVIAVVGDERRVLCSAQPNDAKRAVESLDGWIRTERERREALKRDVR